MFHNQPVNLGSPARLVAVIGLIISIAATPFITPATQARAQSGARQLRVFQKIWRTVNDTYVYPNFNGVDWKGKKAEVEAKIAAGMSDGEFYFTLRKLIESLNDNHSVYLPPYVAEELFQVYFNNGQYEGVGLVTALNREKHYVYVLQVVPG